jgi:hypothetical protein
MSHGSLYQLIFGRKKSFLWFISPLFARSQSLRIIFIPTAHSHFGTLDNILKSVTDELKGIPAEAFQHCYEKWKQRLCHCVAAQGNYFEGDKP